MNFCFVHFAETQSTSSQKESIKTLLQTSHVTSEAFTPYTLILELELELEVDVARDCSELLSLAAAPNSSF